LCAASGCAGPVLSTPAAPSSASSPSPAPSPSPPPTSTPPADRAPAVGATDGPPPALAPPAAVQDPLPAPLPLRHQDTTPGVLLPRAEADDQEVIRVGDLPIRKSHVYDRLFEENPQFTKIQVDALVFDVLLAQQASKHGIFVDARMVDRLVDEEE